MKLYAKPNCRTFREVCTKDEIFLHVEANYYNYAAILSLVYICSLSNAALDAILIPLVQISPSTSVDGYV